MGFFSGPGYQDPTKDASNTLQQIPGTISPYYQPYIDYGLQAGGVMSDQYGQMSSDPQDYYNNIMSGYEPSDSYQYQYGQMQKGMSGDAAAGGFSGTEYDQQRQAEAMQGLLSQDQQQYYNNVSGAQRYGLGGEQHMYDTGYGASSSLADALGTNLAQQAGLQYQGAAGQNQYNQQQHSSNLGLLESMGGAGAYMYGRNR